jgi:hypothetical protein
MHYLLEKNLPDFSELKDENYFQKFELDIMGGLTWPNSYDFAPDYLYEIRKPASINPVSYLQQLFNC